MKLLTPSIAATCREKWTQCAKKPCSFSSGHLSLAPKQINAQSRAFWELPKWTSKGDAIEAVHIYLFIKKEKKERKQPMIFILNVHVTSTSWFNWAQHKQETVIPPASCKLLVFFLTMYYCQRQISIAFCNGQYNISDPDSWSCTVLVSSPLS